MGISKCWGKAVVVAGCLGVMTSVARAGYDENVGAAADSSSSNMNGSMSRSEMRERNAQMLIQTLSEEKTEINSLAGQREVFLRLGGSENRRIAHLWAIWINEHKAAGPTLMRLIRINGGDPMEARILKAPPLGTREQMMMATHKDHMAAVMTSQTRFYMTTTTSIRTAMNKRATLARKHLRQMAPYHRGMMMNGGMDSGMSTGSGGMDTSNDSSMDSSTTTTDTTTTDSGTTDGGTTDGSTTDSGTMDSGTTDSTTTDSTTTDSTTTDSTTTTDGSTTDSTTTDSTTTTDGSTTDSGTMDSGTADSDTSGMDTKGADAAGTSDTESTMNK